MQHTNQRFDVKLVLLCAVTADGFIARNSNDKLEWTADKKFFAKETKKAGVVIIGRKTFDAIGKALPARLNIVLTRKSENYKSKYNLIFTSNSPREIIKMLKNKYEKAFVVGGSEVNSLFAEYLDEIWLTIEPITFGKGVSLFSKQINLDLELIGTEKVNNSIHIKYKVS